MLLLYGNIHFSNLEMLFAIAVNQLRDLVLSSSLSLSLSLCYVNADYAPDEYLWNTCVDDSRVQVKLAVQEFEDTYMHIYVGKV